MSKKLVATTALQFVKPGDVLGVGTGSTVNVFIEALAAIKGKIEGAVSSSEETTQRLKKLGIPVLDLNAVKNVPVYIDGADEVTPQGYMTKGGGAALTREKIIAAVAEQFVCIVDESKQVDVLGRFPTPVEVIPMARSYVAREILHLGGDPVYRVGTVTDNGNVILDVHNLDLVDPIAIEQALNNITGVVMNGIFAKRHANVVVCGSDVIRL